MDKQLFRDVTYGMYVVTTIDEEKRNVGCVINTLTQITSENPIITISLNKDNYTNRALKWNRLFALSIISTETSKDLITKFGYNSSKDTDKFQNIEYELVEDIPVIKENTCGYILAEYMDSVDCNTHDVIIAKVITTKKNNNNTPMTYTYYHENLKGLSPKNAPTYVEKPREISTNYNQYQCNLCGYIYDDSKEKVKFEDLPDDWKCPLCGAPKSQFTKIN